MSLTINAKSYNNDVARTPDSFRYTAVGNSFTAKDYVDLKRAPPAANQPQSKARAEFKLTRTLTDGTVPVGDAIVTVSWSLPQGAAAAEVQALGDDVGSWISSPAADSLVINMKINQ